jgi:hypothetical protein
LLLEKVCSQIAGILLSRIILTLVRVSFLISGFTRGFIILVFFSGISFVIFAESTLLIGGVVVVSVLGTLRGFSTFLVFVSLQQHNKEAVRVININLIGVIH